MLTELIPRHVELSSVDIWQQDESRVGQQGSTTRIWAKTETRPRKVKQQQFISSYIYGAVCAKTGATFGLFLPRTNTPSMQLFLDELSKQAEDGRNITLVMDNAGWHTANDLVVPEHITLIQLPPYSPELNAIEQVWEFLLNHHLANQFYDNYQQIIASSSY